MRDIDGQLSLFDSIDEMINDLKKSSKKAKEALEATEATQAKRRDGEEPDIDFSKIEAHYDADEVQSDSENEVKKGDRSEKQFKENTSVKNKYNGEIYTMLSEKGNCALVRSKDNTVHEMLKSDIELISADE